MFYVFVVCLAFGGTVLVLQMLLSMVGLAGDSLHVDVSHGLDHGGVGDFHGGDLHTGDLHSGDMHGAELHQDGSADHAGSHDSSAGLFRMISIQSVVAAMAFFGLAGLGARSAGATPWLQLLVALVAGWAALYAVFCVMQALARLQSEGNVRIQRAVGQQASVYLRIPAARSGLGKVQVTVQNRTMEYAALTTGPALPTGSKVVVVGIVGGDTLDVAALASDVVPGEVPNTCV